MNVSILSNEELETLQIAIEMALDEAVERGMNLSLSDITVRLFEAMRWASAIPTSSPTRWFSTAAGASYIKTTGRGHCRVERTAKSGRSMLDADVSYIDGLIDKTR